MMAAVSSGPIPANVLIDCVEGDAANVTRTLHRLAARGWLHGTFDSDVSDDRIVGTWGRSNEPKRDGTVALRSRMHARVLEALVEAPERARIHQRILSSLESQPIETAADAGRLAFHAALSVDRQRALEYHLRAAEFAATAGEHAQAAEWHKRCAELQREEGDHEGALASSRAAILAFLKAREGRGADPAREAAAALRVCDETTVRLQYTTPQQRALFAMLHAEVLLLAGWPTSAVRLLEAAMKEQAVWTRETRAQLETMHAHLALRTGQARDVEFALRTALQVAEQRRDAALEGRALAGLAILLAHSDRVPEADGAVASALALAARSGDVEVRTLALASMGAVLEALGDTAAAAERYDEALSLTSGDGALNARAEMTTRSMMLWLRAGVDAVAAKRADTLEDIARKQRCDALAQLVVCVRAVITAHAFPEAIGMQPFERAYEAARDEFVVESIFVLELRAYALVALGSVEEAALVRDDAATAAERCGWTSYARQLRES
jgi:hypothetical protein